MWLSRAASSVMNTTRASLLIRVRDRGDADAWRTFDAIYRPMLLRFAQAKGLGSEAAEEIAQQCMTAIGEHIGTFEYDPQKGRFKAWLRTMANNKVRNYFRDRRMAQAESGHLRGLEDDGDTPDETFDKLWMQQHLWHCLGELQREVDAVTYEAFVAYVIEQKSVDEVCSALKIKPNNLYTIKWRMTDKVAERMRLLLDGEADAM